MCPVVDPSPASKPGSMICLTIVPRGQGGSRSEAAGLRLSCSVRAEWLSCRSGTTSETTSRRAGDPRRRLSRSRWLKRDCGRETGSQFTASMRPGETRWRKRSAVTPANSTACIARVTWSSKPRFEFGASESSVTSQRGPAPATRQQIRRPADPPELSTRGPVLPAHRNARRRFVCDRWSGRPRAAQVDRVTFRAASRPGTPRRARMTSPSTG
jgi:hypothetical protein